MVAIYTIAFFTGLAVMGIELSASRLVAPYFGTSLFVWTNVIAVILAALSLGYYLGGRISERAPRLKVLLSVLLLAGLLLTAIPFVVRPVASAFLFDITAFSSASAIITLGSFLLTVSLFFLPIMLLGMTSPFLIKLVSLERKDMGNVSGRIFAISTVGSIIGTFLPALIFIPLLGTKFTILVFAGLIIVVGLLGLAPRRLFVLVPLVGVPFGALDGAMRPSANLLAERESPYQYIRVFERDGVRQLVYNEGGGVQSLYNPHSFWSGGSYFDVAALMPLLAEGRSVFVVGLAGGTIPRVLRHLYGNDSNFGVRGAEIDGAVVELAGEYFGLDKEEVGVQIVDGRQALLRSSEKYDLIFVDAFTNQLYIPFHLATQEFFELARDHLRPGGILAMNINALDENSELLRAIQNTVASVFPNVAGVPIGIGNHLLIAGERPIPFERWEEAGLADQKFNKLAKELAPRVRPSVFSPTSVVFTDDHAPVEYLTDKMFWEYFVGVLRNNT